MVAFEPFSKKEIAGAVGVALLFLGASFGSDRIAGLVELYIGGGGILAMFLYVVTIIGIVLIPLASTLPLIPIAVALWGNVTAALLTIIGWLISMTLTFLIGRHFGQPLMRRFRFFAAIRNFESMVPRTNLWWGIFFLGMLGAPADVMSYSVGIFTRLRLRQFILAFGLGVIPFAFFITYTATLPIIYQTYIIGLMLIVWLIVYTRLRSRGKHSEEKNEEERLLPSGMSDTKHQLPRRSKIM